MKKDKKTNRTKEKQSIKRLYLLTAMSGIVCALLAVLTFVFFFVPRDKDTYILTVPKLVGLAESDIGRYQDIEVTREWIYSDDGKRGEVISQEPYGGARRKLKRGETYKVTVFISLGEKTEKIPDLCGVGEMSAAAALRMIGARVRSVPIYNNGDDGKVLYTSPRAETEIKQGETVTMFVSRQRTDTPVTVPNFCGMTLSEAYRIALAIGLGVNEYDTNEIEKTVVAQSIPEGARVKNGSCIEFKTEILEEETSPWPPIISENNKSEED